MQTGDCVQYLAKMRNMKVHKHSEGHSSDISCTEKVSEYGYIYYVIEEGTQTMGFIHCSHKSDI